MLTLAKQMLTNAPTFLLLRTCTLMERTRTRTDIKCPTDNVHSASSDNFVNLDVQTQVYTRLARNW